MTTTEECAPIKEVDGIKVFVHRVEPTPADRQRYDEWWRGVIGCRLVDKGAKSGRSQGDRFGSRLALLSGRARHVGGRGLSSFAETLGCGDVSESRG
jgi:hypothetical protein